MMCVSHSFLTATRLFSPRSRLNSCWRRCFLTFTSDKFGYGLLLFDAVIAVLWCVR
jgi:hypothetical protein